MNDGRPQHPKGRWFAFIVGAVVGGVISAITTVAVAESRFAQRSPIAIIEELARNSAYPRWDLSHGIFATFSSHSVTEQLGLRCRVQPNDGEPKIYRIDCQQNDLFYSPLSIGRPRFTLKVCDSQICDFGRWQL